jgi:hypothetical protein
MEETPVAVRLVLAVGTRVVGSRLERFGQRNDLQCAGERSPASANGS